jgi:CubicO group peptidase (beta-lactamase class C family)
MRKLLSIIAACALTFQVVAQPAFIQDSLDQYISREMQRWKIPGLAFAIIKDGKVLLTKGYGVREQGKPDKVDEYTLFQIASNSKAFTGTALAMLDAEKRIMLDEKVTRYMPWFRLYDSTSTALCTVRDLLCHRIGLQTFQGDFLNWGSTLTRRQIIERMSLTPPVHPFRYTYGYCNAAYITAGELIPQMIDTTWDDFLQHRFFKPLNMVHTNTSYKSMLTDKNACTPHTLVRGNITKLPLANIDNMAASAAINSCVADMSKWVLMQLNKGMYEGKEIVPNKVLLETRKSAMVVGDPQGGLFKTRHFITYGLGWRSYDYEGRRVFEHSGGANGFVTKTEFVPEENLGVIVYTNTDANSLYDALCKQVIEAYFNLPYRNLSELYYNNGARQRDADTRTERERDSLVKLNIKTPLPLNEYTGTYQNAFYGKVWVKNEKGVLKLYFEHHPNNVGTLRHLGNNEFIAEYSDKVCGVEPFGVTINNGKVSSVKVKVNDFIDYLSYEFERTDI